VPVSLKIFLTALAILDDLLAIIIIAVFYTADLSLLSLGLATVTLAVLFALNRAGVERLLPYLAVGAVLWYFVLQSGIHATLAGVALAFMIPLKASPGRLTILPHPCTSWSTPSTMGRLCRCTDLWLRECRRVTVGLQLGDPGAAPSTRHCGRALRREASRRLSEHVVGRKAQPRDCPEDATWPQVYGISLLCGIAFHEPRHRLLAFQRRRVAGCCEGRVLSVCALCVWERGTPSGEERAKPASRRATGVGQQGAIKWHSDTVGRSCEGKVRKWA
jgi:NhaA family Na+:H+ antiporter